jgi:hypothetical protein
MGDVAIGEVESKVYKFGGWRKECNEIKSKFVLMSNCPELEV